MSCRRIVGLTLAFTLAWTGVAAGGWVIEEVSTGAERTRQQITLQANRMKTVVFDGGRPSMGVLVDLDGQTITQINYAERSYTTATVREYRDMLQRAREALAPTAMPPELREAMEKLPPEQRQMMEQMLRSQGAPSAGTPECRAPNIEIRKTGQQTTVAGFPATRHDVFIDGKADSEMWIAPAITIARELDRDKLARFASEMAALAGCGPSGAAGLGGLEAGWNAMTEGYPVRRRDRSGGGQEVVKAEQRAVPATEFQPPAGFTARSLSELLSR